MDALQLSHILSHDTSTSPFFKGVYARDTLPPLQINSCAIVNADDSSSPGSHWLALFLKTQKIVEFFDSYGNSPDFYGIDTSYYSKIEWNSIVFQSPTSNVCGQYCIYFLYKRCQGHSMYSIVDVLYQKRKTDFQIYQFVKKKYGVRLVFRK